MPSRTRADLPQEEIQRDARQREASKLARKQVDASEEANRIATEANEKANKANRTARFAVWVSFLTLLVATAALVISILNGSRQSEQPRPDDTKGGQEQATSDYGDD